MPLHPSAPGSIRAELEPCEQMVCKNVRRGPLPNPCKGRCDGSQIFERQHQEGADRMHSREQTQTENQCETPMENRENIHRYKIVYSAVAVKGRCPSRSHRIPLNPFELKWSGRLDSNQRPPAPEGAHRLVSLRFGGEPLGALFLGGAQFSSPTSLAGSLEMGPKPAQIWANRQK